MTKYLDRENCRALLPDIGNLPLIDQLENCLSAINDNSSKYQGLLKKLRKQNSKSSNYLSSTDRLLPCSLDIALMACPSTGNISVQARQMPDPSPCRLNIVLDLSSDTSWRATMPLQFLLKDWGDANKGYQGYIHVINHNLPRMGTLMQMRERQANDKDAYYYDSHYLKVISGQAKLLTPSQVYKIRELNAKGLLPGKIAEDVGALNIKQVKKVISGRTYRRIKQRAE